jgi:hypothetical protein
MITTKIIYKMLTEDTGKHMLDSGGAYGRHWQHNQKKSFKDFKNEPVYNFKLETNQDKKIDFVNCTKSLFHHLSDSLEYSERETKKLNDWINENKYDCFKNPEGRASCLSDVELYFESFNKYVNCLYTYNDDNILSQDFQIVYAGDIYESDLIALSIHNGCDARGGFTDYKIFRCDWDMLLDYNRFRISTFIESDKTPLFKKELPITNNDFYWDFEYDQIDTNYKKDLIDFELVTDPDKNLKDKILLKNNKYYLDGKFELTC